jgi:hypothetical protein
MAKLFRVTERHLSEKQSQLQLTCRTQADGSPNPNYAQLAELLPKLQQHRERTEAIRQAACGINYRPNNYAGVCSVTGIKVGEGCGFARKNDLGRCVVKSFGVVASELGMDSDDLPELPAGY